MIDFNMQQNLIQIHALKNSRTKSSFTLELLRKRQDYAKREIARLRKFASLKDSRVADHCRKLADSIESELG